MAVSKRLRFEILRRDNNTCRYCGGQPPDVALTIDHVLPVALGGTDAADNLVAACKDCNAGKAASKGDESVVAQVSDDAVRWAKAVEKAGSNLREFRESGEMEALLHWWDSWGYTEDGERKTIHRPADARTTIATFWARGLTYEDLYEFISIAMERPNRKDLYRAPTVYGDDLWRYFCGICLRTLDSIQEQARAEFEAQIRAEKEKAAQAEATRQWAALRRLELRQTRAFLQGQEPHPNAYRARAMPMSLLYAS